MAPNNHHHHHHRHTTNDDDDRDEAAAAAPPPLLDTSRTFELVWPHLVLFPAAHAVAVYGAYLAATAAASPWTTAFTAACYWLSMLGLWAGAHRLWSHRAYKAAPGLQVFLMLCTTMAFQGRIRYWVREHRVHHRHSDTDADPVNPRRGFFFAHIGWLMVRKHPAVAAKGRQIDMADVHANPVLAFQDRHYAALTALVAAVVPALVPMALWHETPVNAVCVAVVLRWVCSLHATFSINSFAHLYGAQPYDVAVRPRENLFVSLVCGGEGWHNYHHTFPWDYRASEHGFVNFTTVFIRWCAQLGWASDLKTVAGDVVRRRIRRTGDGSHSIGGGGGGVGGAEADGAAAAVMVVTHRQM